MDVETWLLTAAGGQAVLSAAVSMVLQLSASAIAGSGLSRVWFSILLVTILLAGVFLSRVEAVSAIAGPGLLGSGFSVVLVTDLSVTVFSWLVEAVSAGAGAVFTGCVDTISRASCSVVPLVSHVKAALVVELVGAGSLDAGSSMALGRGLLAAWSSVVFSAASAIAAVLALFDLLACSVARFGRPLLEA